MELYYVNNDYVDYLREFDNRIYVNKTPNRPYVGVVLDVNNCPYYVPLSSPKQKHFHMKNAEDFRKIANGKYGVMNFNYMIPVPNDQLTKIDIDNIPDVKYKRLLQNQSLAIQADRENVLKTAYKLYSITISDDRILSKHLLNIKRRCCDFVLLEEKMKSYIE